MSFGWTAATWIAISAAATTGVALYNADGTRRAANKANDQAKSAALATAQQADEANNRANAKAPDSAAAMAANILAAKSGNSSTMLTGPGGIDPTSLTLGKNSLLGGG